MRNCSKTLALVQFDPNVTAANCGAMLVDREAAHRNDRRLTRLLAQARLKYGQGCLEKLDIRASRDLDARLITSLGHGEWIERGQPLLISGPTGVGKTWLACALAQKACRLGKSALYARLPRLLEELRVARGEGAHKRRLIALAKIEVLVLDDWAQQPLEPYGREDVLEIMDDRAERHATIITAQLPIEHWCDGFQYVSRGGAPPRHSPAPTMRVEIQSGLCLRA
jgi:DNA replication protein DnaC